MKDIKRYAIRTKSGKFLRLKYELSADVKEYYEQGIEEDEFVQNAIPKIIFSLTEDKSNTQIWTTNYKTICERIIHNRFNNFDIDKEINSINNPNIEIDYKQELTAEFYEIKQISIKEVA